jgi:RNA-directed DNA polymerase
MTEEGVTPPKKNRRPGVRPLVIGSIENRVVRRAILDVLQGYGVKWDHHTRYFAGVPAIQQIMATPTSVGGIKDKGVPQGLALIDAAVADGQVHFIRSDIKKFFTRIPVGEVKAFLANAVDDPDFLDLFGAALETNLSNRDELEERKLFQLFPDPEIGVAQGSALSALAGNIVLRPFDSQIVHRQHS